MCTYIHSGEIPDMGRCRITGRYKTSESPRIFGGGREILASIGIAREHISCLCVNVPYPTAYIFFFKFLCTCLNLLYTLNIYLCMNISYPTVA